MSKESAFDSRDGSSPLDGTLPSASEPQLSIEPEPLSGGDDTQHDLELIDLTARPASEHVSAAEIELDEAAAAGDQLESIPESTMERGSWSFKRLFSPREYVQLGEELKRVWNAGREVFSLVWEDAESAFKKSAGLELANRLAPLLQGATAALIIHAVKSGSAAWAAVAGLLGIGTALCQNWVSQRREEFDTELDIGCRTAIERGQIDAACALSGNSLETEETQKQLVYVKDKGFIPHEFLKHSVGTVAGGVALLVFTAAVCWVSPAAGLVTLAVGLPLLFAAKESRKAWSECIDRIQAPNQKFWNRRDQILDPDEQIQARMAGCLNRLPGRALEALEEAEGLRQATVLETLRINKIPVIFREVLTGSVLYAVIQYALEGTFSLEEVSFMGGAIAGLSATISSLCSSIGSQMEICEKLKPTFALLNQGHQDAELDQARVRSIDWSKSPKIEFENVSFTYPGKSEPALSKVSFTIESGEYLMLMGKNRSGKSTLIKLMCGLYEPTEGRILINGVDMKEIAPSSLRHRSGVVSQEYGLLNRYSVRENLAFGAPVDGSGRDVQAVAEEFRLHDMYTSLDAVVGKKGEGGFKPTGGQRQRFAIARAFMSDPKLLILDEPFSALDDDWVDELGKKFAAEQDCTRVLITHDTMQGLDAKKILILENGKVAAHDTPAKLMAGRNIFSRAVERRQAKLKQEPK